MTLLILSFVALSAVIVLAGTLLAVAADCLAESTGLGRTLAGLVLLAGATSLPELAVGWSAARLGAADLALGELLGSSLCNLFILALLDLVTTTRGRMLSKMAAAHALSATTSSMLTAIVLLSLLLKPAQSWFGVGPGSLAVLVAYLLSLRLVYFDQRAVQARQPPPRALRRLSGGRALLAYVASAAAVFVAAPRLTAVAEELATRTRLGETFFGTVFLAAMTSLPEGVSTFAAIRLGAIDMAIGNIFGSNAFNMALIGVIDGASPTPLLAAASPAHAITATAVILVTTVATLSLLYQAERRWHLVEPDALLIALLVLGSLFLVYGR